jgi:predicted aspartyl protease
LSNTSQPILTRSKFLIDTGNTLFLIISKETYLKLGKPAFKPEGVKIKTGNGIITLPLFDCDLILETLEADYSIECEVAVSKTLPVDIIGSPALEAICQKTDTDLVFNYRNRRLELRTS